MAAEALQAINRILQYNQQRDQTKVQEALGFMEMAQQRQFKEIELQLKKEEMGSMERYRQDQIDIEKDKLFYEKPHIWAEKIGEGYKNE